MYKAWCHYDLGKGPKEGISRGLESLTDWGRGKDSVTDVNISKCLSYTSVVGPTRIDQSSGTLMVGPTGIGRLNGPLYQDMSGLEVGSGAFSQE